LISIGGRSSIAPSLGNSPDSWERDYFLPEAAKQGGLLPAAKHYTTTGAASKESVMKKDANSARLRTDDNSKLEATRD
jgi:hypothetical protein